jgi:predicted metal-binding protein
MAQGHKDSSKLLDKRRKLIKELIGTEETYVHQLELLTDIYLRPLRTLAIQNPTHFSYLFSNIEEIMHLHRK